MDKAAKAAIKEERKANKMALRKKNQQLGAYPRMHPVISVVARPIVAGAAAYASGAADAALGTPTNQHWPSFVIGGVAVAGGVVSTLAGHPTVGAGLADVSAGPVSWVAGASGFDMVRRRQQAAGAQPHG